MIYLIAVMGIVALDQFLKHIVQTRLELLQSIPVIDDFFSITYIQNFGAAFSILQNQKILLTVLPSIMIAVLLIFIFLKKGKEQPMLLWGLSLIAAGGIGNLLDRIRLGYVVDFFDFHVFPVFNIADISVCAGCGIVVLYLLVFETRLKGEKKDDGGAGQQEI